MKNKPRQMFFVKKYSQKIKKKTVCRSITANVQINQFSSTTKMSNFKPLKAEKVDFFKRYIYGTTKVACINSYFLRG